MTTRFEAKGTRKRRLDWGEIIFTNKFCITVKTSQYTIIFHRYGAPSGHYMKEWRAFRRELIRRKLPSLYDVYRYANNYEITHYVKGVSLDTGVDRKIKLGENR